jgi:hypothetical protein
MIEEQTNKMSDSWKRTVELLPLTFHRKIIVSVF